MKWIGVYKCFCEVTRLRMLNVLQEGPLCVCHLQAILGEGQVKISKQLAYLKQHGVVESQRHNNWTIYRLSSQRSELLDRNLSCLQDLRSEEPIFHGDLVRRNQLVDQMCLGEIPAPCSIVSESREGQGHHE